MGSTYWEKQAPSLWSWLLGERKTLSLEALQKCYNLERGLASQLLAHVGRAVYPDLQAVVKRLAVEHESHATLLLTKLRALGAEPQSLDTSPKEGPNYWKRMSLDLEAAQALLATYTELTSQVDREDVRDLLEQLRLRTEASQDSLFRLVARADPYAVD